MNRHTSASIIVSFACTVTLAGSADAAFSAGFEAPSYTSGPIAGQDGWTQINELRINDDPIPFLYADSANFYQLRVFLGTIQAGMIVDDLSIIPEPSAPLALIAAAGVILGRRRTVRR